MFELKPLSTGIEVITLRLRSLYSLKFREKVLNLSFFSAVQKNDNLEFRIFSELFFRRFRKGSNVE